MSRLGRPPLAGGSTVAAGKNSSKLSRHYLSSRRAIDCAKLLANLAGDRAGCPASLAAAPSMPLTPTLPPTWSKRYALRSAERSITAVADAPPQPTMMLTATPATSFVELNLIYYYYLFIYHYVDCDIALSRCCHRRSIRAAAIALPPLRCAPPPRFALPPPPLTLPPPSFRQHRAGALPPPLTLCCCPGPTAADAATAATPLPSYR
jgi:hypothetical protein